MYVLRYKSHHDAAKALPPQPRFNVLMPCLGLASPCGYCLSLALTFYLDLEKWDFTSVLPFCALGLGCLALHRQFSFGLVKTASPTSEILLIA